MEQLLEHHSPATQQAETYIQSMYRQFLAQYRIVPNMLFLSESDFQQLSVLIHQSIYNGMEVQRTSSPKSYVALVSKNT